MHRHFTGNDTQMFNEHRKIHSISSAIREMHMETRARCHCTSSRTAETKTDNTKGFQGREYGSFLQNEIFIKCTAQQMNPWAFILEI